MDGAGQPRHRRGRDFGWICQGADDDESSRPTASEAAPRRFRPTSIRREGIEGTVLIPLFAKQASEPSPELQGWVRRGQTIQSRKYGNGCFHPGGTGFNARRVSQC